MSVKREYSTPQVAKLVGCSSDHVYKLARSGLLAFDVVGKKKRMFNVDEVKAAMAERRRLIADEERVRAERRRELTAEKKAKKKARSLDSNWASDGRQDKVDVGKPDDGYWVGVREKENGSGGGGVFNWGESVRGSVRPLPPVAGVA